MTPAQRPSDALNDETRQFALLVNSVFEPFFTTKPVGRGSGLGLSQVFGFTSHSGGFTQLDSAPGEGTQVTLCFPVPEV